MMGGFRRRETHDQNILYEKQKEIVVNKQESE